MAINKKADVIPVSFKKNVLDQTLLGWTYEQGELVGNSAYIKSLIKEDRERKLKNCPSKLEQFVD